MSRELLDPSLVLTSALAFISAMLLLVTVPRPHTVRPLGANGVLLVAGAIVLAAMLAGMITGQIAGALAAATLAGAICLIIRKGMPRLSAVGVLHTALAPVGLISGAAWAYRFVEDQSFPGWVVAVVAAGAGVALLGFAFRFAAGIVEDAVYTHAEWSRPTRALAGRVGGFAPRVSIHVPCYAVPPEVVLQSLQGRAELR
jgi:hypothetical protein